VFEDRALDITSQIDISVEYILGRIEREITTRQSRPWPHSTHQQYPFRTSTFRIEYIVCLIDAVRILSQSVLH